MAQNPIVTITMDNGDVMKAELYPEIAPNTVRSLVERIDAQKVSTDAAGKFEEIEELS